MPHPRLALVGSVICLCISAFTTLAQSQANVSGAKAGAYVSTDLSRARGGAADARPSAALGVFSSLYLSQGDFTAASAAWLGIEAQRQIIIGFTDVEASETFSLLKEFAALLQTDVADMLNRSNDRTEALDTYVSSLQNIMTLAERKQTELKTLEEEQQATEKERRQEFRELQRLVRSALREDDYETAGANQEAMLQAEKAYAEAESRHDQTERIMKTYKKLIKVAKERLLVITENRRIILAGLKVVDVPGIEEFELIEDR